jgi:predicted phage terminase large subunit-like protein
MPNTVVRPALSWARYAAELLDPPAPVFEEWRETPDRLGAHLDPTYTLPAHIRLIGDRLAETVNRGHGRLIINMPAAHGKSWLIGTWLPTWVLHHNPAARVLLATYSDSLARRSGRSVLRIIGEHGDKLGLALAGDATKADDWELASGGGMATASIGGRLTGMHGDVLIIDDPHKGWQAAQSKAEKAAVWDFYASVMRLRAKPGATIVVCHTRWVPDDLAGRLLAHSDAGSGEHWDVIRLPGLADGGTTSSSGLVLPPDPIGREPGEALWPEAFPAEEIEALRLTMTRVQFSGLVQQLPTVAEGEVFLRTKWGRVDQLPPSRIMAPSGGQRGGLLLVRRWDLAATQKESGNDPDFTVGVLCALDETSGMFYILDVVRGQWNSGEVRRVITDVAESDAEEWGRANVLIRGEAEPGSSGKTVKEEWEDRLLGYPVRWIGSTGDKVTRADPLVAAQQNDRVFLVRREMPDGSFQPAPWWMDLIEEFADFPSSGVHDDQVDAVSLAFADLTELRRKRRRGKASISTVAEQQIAGRWPRLTG